MQIDVNDPAYLAAIGAQAGRDPRRLVMLMALSHYLRTTLGDVEIHRGRMVLTQNDPVPAVAILDNVDPDRYPSLAGRNGYELPTQDEDYVLLVQGWAVDDKVNPTDPAHRLMARVKKALAGLLDRGHPDEPPQEGDVYLLGGLITRLSVEPGVVRPPIEQSSAEAFFWLRISVGFTENPDDPFDLS